MSTIANVTIVSADEVRTWARKRGMQVADAGRLNAEVVDAFNKAHKARQYVVTRSQPARVVKVVGTRTQGKRKYQFKVQTTIPEVRAWAKKAGFPVGVRGRISAEVAEAYANSHA